MTKKQFWDKWKPDRSDYLLETETKSDFMDDLKAVIAKHTKPYEDALENISSEIEDFFGSYLEAAKKEGRRVK